MKLALLVVVAACMLAAASAVNVDASAAAARRHLRSREQLDARSELAAVSSLESSVAARSTLALSFDSIGAEIRTIATNFKNKVASMFPKSLATDIRTHISGFISKIENAANSLKKFISSALASLAGVFSCPLPQRIVEINKVAATKLGFEPLNEAVYCSYKSTINGLSSLFSRVTSWDKSLLLGRLESIPSLYKPGAFLETSAEARDGTQTSAVSTEFASVKDRLDCSATMTAVVVLESAAVWCDDLLNAIDNSATASDPPQIAVSVIAGLAQLTAASLRAVCTEDVNSSGSSQWKSR